MMSMFDKNFSILVVQGLFFSSMERCNFPS